MIDDEKPPQLEMSDVVDIRSLTKEDLLKVPHQVGKWYCCASGCLRFGRVLDFGLSPVVWCRKRWVNISLRIWLCGRHYGPYVKAIRSDKPIPFDMKTAQQLEKERAEIFTTKPLT